MTESGQLALKRAHIVAGVSACQITPQRHRGRQRQSRLAVDRQERGARRGRGPDGARGRGDAPAGGSVDGHIRKPGELEFDGPLVTERRLGDRCCRGVASGLKHLRSRRREEHCGSRHPDGKHENGTDGSCGPLTPQGLLQCASFIAHGSIPTGRPRTRRRRLDRFPCPGIRTRRRHCLCGTA